MKVSFKSLVAPSFYGIHHKIKRHKHTHFWLRGGRGSTKSSFISLEIILGLMKHPKTNAICFRKYGTYLKDSVFEQLLWAVEALGVKEKWKIGLSPLKLTYRKTGQVILFRGVDDPKKSKSIKCANGYFAYVWYEEADEFECLEEIETINRSLLRGGERFWVFYSFNPPKSKNVWVNHEVTQPRADKCVHASTYLSVPKDWLGEQFIFEAEHLAKVNEEKYRHVYLGEATGTGGEVFKNVTLRPISDEEIWRFDTLRRGLDWGYAGDPFAYVAAHYDAARKRMYVFYEYYKLGVSNSKAAQVIQAENVCNQQVVCDSAEPKSVDALRLDYGIAAYGAEKGPGSREEGMKFLAEELEEIVIDPVRCPNCAREFVGYELEQDAYGNFKAKYPKKNDHTIDALRYATEEDRMAKRRLKPRRHDIW